MPDNDNRAALPDGSELKLSGKCGDVVYRSLKEIGRGGSCIVYKGIRKEPASGITGEIGFVRTQIIKEFYPLSVPGLARKGKRISVPQDQQESFSEHKKKFLKGSHLLGMYYEKEPAKTLPRPFFETEANGTVYLVSDPGAGVPMDEEYRAKLSLYQIAQMMKSLCAYTYEHFHQNGSLYLDFKPDNIFQGEIDGNYYIALFDFDTVIKKEALKERTYKFITYSEGWAPPEQKQWNTSQISERTDIYAIGAVFFWLLTGKKPKSEKQAGGFDSDLEKIEKRKLYLRKISALCKDASDTVVDTINEILCHTLRISPDGRYDSVLEIQKALDPLFGEGFGEKNNGGKSLADLYRDLTNTVLEKVDEGFSTVNEKLDEVIEKLDAMSIPSYYSSMNGQINDAPFYELKEMIDRTDFLEEVESYLHEWSKPVYIYSIGGLGKSLVAKAYCNSDYAEKYRNIFWVDMTDIITDIRRTIINSPRFVGNRTEKSESDENINTLFRQFIMQARDFGDKVLLVVDNVTSVEQIDSIETYLPDLKWSVLVTTRATKGELSFRKRVIPLDTLTMDYCEKLFYSHYDESEENKEKNRETLHKLFRFLEQHTKIIELSALVAEEKHLTIQNLYEGIVERATPSRNVDIYQKIEETTVSLFHLANLIDNEKEILSYFTLLPSKPIPEEVLTKWMSATETQTDESSIIDTMSKLYKLGWLQFSKNILTKECSYQCHPLIQLALKKQLHDQLSSELIDAFILRVANFFYSNFSEFYNKSYLIPYFDVAESILDSYGVKTEGKYALLKNYTSLLNHFYLAPEKAFKLASELKESYYANANLSDEEKNKRLEVLFIYNEAYIGYSSEENKYKKADILKRETFELAKSFLPETDIVFLRAKRLYAITLRSNDKKQDAITMLNEIVQVIESGKCNMEIPSKRAWKYLTYLVNLSLAVSYTNLYLSSEGTSEERKNYILTALKIRKKCLATTEYLFGDNPTGLYRIYGELGMTYIYVYDMDKNPDTLKNAEFYLEKVYQIKKDNVPRHSHSMAITLARLSFLYQKQGKLEEALALAKETLQIRLDLHGKIPLRTFILSYRKMADIQYDLFQSANNRMTLDEALNNIEEALKIAQHLYAEYPDHTEIKRCERVKIKILEAQNQLITEGNNAP